MRKAAEPKIPPESERHFQAFVVKLARSFGWRVYHTYDSRRSSPGFPDLVMVKAGRVIAAELKADRGKTTEAQNEWLDDLHNAGVETWVWRPADKGRLALVLQ